MARADPEVARFDDAPRPAGADGPLKRALGPKMLLLFVTGDILGAGIYARVGGVAAEVGGAIWLSFLVALVIASFTALSYAELVSKYPGAGAPPCSSTRPSGCRSSPSWSPSRSWPPASPRRHRWRER